MALNLYAFFERIAACLHTDAATLWRYASEDTEIGGYVPGHDDTAGGDWIVGSIFEVEGKALYAIVRALKPDRILEIGTRRGCSTTHLLSALNANGHGQLVSLDIARFEGVIDPRLQRRWQFQQTDAIAWLKEVTDKEYPFDMVWEDGDHAYEWTRDVISLINEKLDPKLLISHDAAHPLVGNFIRQAWDDVFGRRTYKVALIDDNRLPEPTDCGFAYRFKGE